jgi:thiol:disulfide interchange protein DsbC
MKMSHLMSLPLLLTAFSSYSANNLDPETMIKALSEDGDVKHIEKLPIGELNFIETTKGLTYLVSSNGRFVIKGELVDVWKNKAIGNAMEAYDLKYLTLSQMGIVDDEMGIIKIGNPAIPKQGYLFLDPQSTYTKEIIDTIIDDQKSYHLDIMLIPQLEGSNKIIQRLWCAVDKNAALMDLIYRTTTAIKQKENCNLRPIIKNRALFGLMDNPKTPLTVRIDGYRISGVALDLKSFLNNTRDKIEAKAKAEALKKKQIKENEINGNIEENPMRKNKDLYDALITPPPPFENNEITTYEKL